MKKARGADARVDTRSEPCNLLAALPRSLFTRRRLRAANIKPFIPLGGNGDACSCASTDSDSVAGFI